MAEAQDSIRHSATAELNDSTALLSDSVHVSQWRFETLQEVPGMYQLDSIPGLKLSGFHKKTVWKGTFDSYASQTQFYHKELPPVRNGQVGVPVEFSISNDSFMSMGLFFCILFSILMVARSWGFTCFQMKNLFRMPRENSITMRETAKEMNYQLFFSVQGVLMMALFAYSMARSTLKDGEDFGLNDYQLIGVYFAVFMIYRGLCSLLDAMVLPVYFDKAKRAMWAGTRLFLIALQGALMLPVILVQFYFHLNLETVTTCVMSIVGVTLLLRFYKAYCIFFKKDGAFLHFLLYLVTLKLVPLALIIGVALFIATYLKINI